MKWHKSPDELIQSFEHCLPMAAGVERKPMFGYPCAFVNGHLFCGLHQDSVIVRLPEARREALVEQGGRIFEPMPGQAMKEYVVAPADIVADRESLRALLGEALAHASSLAPRPKQARAAKPTASARNPATAKKVAPAGKPIVVTKKTAAKKAPAKKKAAPARKAPAKKKAAPAKKAPRKKTAPAKRVATKAARKTTPKKKRSR